MKVLCVGGDASSLECSLRGFTGGHSCDIQALFLVPKYFYLDVGVVMAQSDHKGMKSSTWIVWQSRGAGIKNVVAEVGLRRSS